MRRFVLAAASILALPFSASGQSEGVTVERIVRPGNRVIFVSKPTTNDMQCQSINASTTTPQIAGRLGRTILAEALVYTGNTVGYVFLISYANGPHEVYFSSYMRRECILDETQSHKRVFVGENRFNDAKAYYHSLFNELSE